MFGIVLLQQQNCNVQSTGEKLSTGIPSKVNIFFQNHCYRKCPATKGKHFKEEAISGDIGITDFAGNAPALEILAQVVARPNDDPMGTVHTSELLKERGPKRKFSESSVGLVLPGKSSQRKSDGLGLTPSSFSPPIPAGWPIDSIASVSSSGGLHHAGRSGMSGDGRHMLSQASSMLPHHGFLGLSPHGMENTSDQTMLFLGSNTPNQHLAANRASGMGAASYPSIPSHHYDMSSLMTSSAVIGPGHMSLPGAGTWSTQHQSFNYILPRESDPYGPSRHTMPFPLHAGAGFALSPRAVTTANTPTLLAHIAPTPPETGRSGILQQLPLHMGGGSETQFRESYIPYSPSGPSISSDRGDSAAHLLLGVSGQGMPPVSKLHGEEELAMSVASSTKTVGESRSGEKQSNRDRE